MYFLVKIHHRNYGVITKRFADRDKAYAEYLRAMSAPEWHDCVTMSFGPNGFVLNQWRRPS